MADSVTFYRNLIATVNQFVQLQTQLETIQDRMAKDPTLAAAAAAAANASGRTDLQTVDFENVGTAITQVTFTLNSGTPPQISYLYKVL